MLSTSSGALNENPGTIHHSAFRKRLLKEVCYYGKLHNSKNIPQLKKRKCLAVNKRYTKYH